MSEYGQLITEKVDPQFLTVEAGRQFDELFQSTEVKAHPH